MVAIIDLTPSLSRAIDIGEPYVCFIKYCGIGRHQRMQTKSNNQQVSSGSNHVINNASISYYLDKWERMERYKQQEKAINLLFHELCPEHDNVEEVLLKVSVLNDFYGTQIYDKYSVASGIANLNMVSERIKLGDQSLVAEIALATIDTTKKARNNYSFATKYCSFHNPGNYPIYDSFVDNMLWSYMKLFHYTEFKRCQLKDYEEFYKVISRFREHFGLEKFTFKEIDIFLWFKGKEAAEELQKKKESARKAA